MRKRSFEQLKKSMLYNEFNNFCKKMTEEYANSEAQFARTYYTTKYNISISCYYKIIEYAIVTNLVNDAVVSKAMNKAVENQKLHNRNAGCRSIIKYSKMYSQRCEHIAISYTNDEIRKIATNFADNPDISKEDLAASYGISRKVFELVLIRAIEDNIVEDATVTAMEKRSVENAAPEKAKRTQDYFTALKRKREANKEKITI